MNGAATPTAAATGGNFMPTNLSEWVIVIVVGCFIYMVKRQNDGILPALAEVVSTMKALPVAIKDAVSEAVEKADRAREHARERETTQPDRRA